MSDIRNLMEGGLEDYLKNELGSFSVKAQETMPAAAQ
jgi:hypothetical protein